MKSNLSSTSFSISTGKAEAKASMPISSKPMRHFQDISDDNKEKIPPDDEETFSELKFWTIAIEDERALSSTLFYSKCLLFKFVDSDVNLHDVTIVF
jgi:hypothetical protein